MFSSPSQTFHMKTVLLSKHFIFVHKCLQFVSDHVSNGEQYYWSKQLLCWYFICPGMEAKKMTWWHDVITILWWHQTSIKWNSGWAYWLFNLPVHCMTVCMLQYVKQRWFGVHALYNDILLCSASLIYNATLLCLCACSSYDANLLWCACYRLWYNLYGVHHNLWCNFVIVCMLKFMMQLHWFDLPQQRVLVISTDTGLVNSNTTLRHLPVLLNQ